MKCGMDKKNGNLLNVVEIGAHPIISQINVPRKEDDSDASDRSIWKLSLLSDVASFLGYGFVNF